jgi:hypothetical protein
VFLKQKQKKTFSFEILCNGYRHLNPVLIEGINETNCKE